MCKTLELCLYNLEDFIRVLQYKDKFMYRPIKKSIWGIRNYYKDDSLFRHRDFYFVLIYNIKYLRSL